MMLFLLTAVLVTVLNLQADSVLDDVENVVSHLEYNTRCSFVFGAVQCRMFFDEEFPLNEWLIIYIYIQKLLISKIV